MGSDGEWVGPWTRHVVAPVILTALPPSGYPVLCLRGGNPKPSDDEVPSEAASVPLGNQQEMNPPIVPTKPFPITHVLFLLPHRPRFLITRHLAAISLKPLTERREERGKLIPSFE